MRKSTRALPIFLLLSALALSLALSGDPVHAAPQATLSVTMSNPTCVQASATAGACYILIRSISASASDTSFTGLDISVDGKVRARLQPFFETTVYAADRMFGQGFLVTCGRSNSSGDPKYGALHTVDYKGYLFGSSTPAAYGLASVFCPAYDGAVYLPLVRK
ncbi:MAG TPA: hypothetical protein VMP08_19395 [Anaerolineae bacterium]|nr:hypothetical protein [Anaerolineae bacterium]